MTALSANTHTHIHKHMHSYKILQNKCMSNKKIKGCLELLMVTQHRTTDIHEYAMISRPVLYFPTKEK